MPFVRQRERIANKSPEIAASSRVARARHCNLVLVAKRRRGHWTDFRTIAGIIQRLAPDIHVSVVTDRFYNAWHPGAWLRPTLFVSPAGCRRLRPLRGRIVQNRFWSKSQEYAALEAHHVPLPRWALLTETESPDLSDFSDYVVTKPDCGGRGADVKIKRRGRVRWKPPTNSRAVELGQTGLIVQEFIYTGPWPVSYRVTTFFGRVLFAWRVTAAQERRPLLGPGRFRDGEAGGGMSIVASGTGCKFELIDEPEVLDLAQRAHGAFPDHPLLGFDILRDAASGRLYVIEANTCGQLWHFSSPTGLSIQHDNHIDFAGQFNGLEVAARTLIDETRRRAS